ncbi:hypothetical protein RKF72_00010 [Klebsiella pneumoniae]|nr:hypothetical protein [Klebsiella pneumoniae]
MRLSILVWLRQTKAFRGKIRRRRCEQADRNCEQVADRQHHQVRQSVTDTAAEINATIDLEIARVSKTLADGDAALNAQIKTAENGLKQSLSQVNTTLTNAV